MIGSVARRIWAGSPRGTTARRKPPLSKETICPASPATLSTNWRPSMPPTTPSPSIATASLPGKVVSGVRKTRHHEQTSSHLPQGPIGHRRRRRHGLRRRGSAFLQPGPVGRGNRGVVSDVQKVATNCEDDHCMAAANDDFDPYHKWLGIPREQRPVTHYQLLGIAPTEKDLDVIEDAAIRQTTHVRSYQLGPHAEACQRVLNEIASARQTLLNPEKRRQYDASLPRPAPPTPTAVVAAPVVTAPSPTKPSTRPKPAKKVASPRRAPSTRNNTALLLGLAVGGVSVAVLAIVALQWIIGPIGAGVRKDTPPGAEPIARSRAEIGNPPVRSPQVGSRRSRGDRQGRRQKKPEPDKNAGRRRRRSKVRPRPRSRARGEGHRQPERVDAAVDEAFIRRAPHEADPEHARGGSASSAASPATSAASASTFRSRSTPARTGFWKGAPAPTSTATPARSPGFRQDGSISKRPSFVPLAGGRAQEDGAAEGGFLLRKRRNLLAEAAASRPTCR